MNPYDKWTAGVEEAPYALINSSKGVTFKASDFEEAAANLAKDGEVFGIYHTATGKSTGAREASWFVECCGEYAKSDKVVLVLSYDKNVSSKAKRVAYAKEFLNTVKELTGKTPVIWMDDACIESADWDLVSNEYKLLVVVDGVSSKEEEKAEEVVAESIAFDTRTVGNTVTEEVISDPMYYKVKCRDTLNKIAIKYRTSVKAIKELNPDIQSIVYPGQRIRVK